MTFLFITKIEKQSLEPVPELGLRVKKVCKRISLERHENC